MASKDAEAACPSRAELRRPFAERRVDEGVEAGKGQSQQQAEISGHCTELVVMSPRDLGSYTMNPSLCRRPSLRQREAGEHITSNATLGRYKDGLVAVSGDALDLQAAK